MLSGRIHPGYHAAADPAESLAAYVDLQPDAQMPEVDWYAAECEPPAGHAPGALPT